MVINCWSEQTIKAGETKSQSWHSVQKQPQVKKPQGAALMGACCFRHRRDNEIWSRKSNDDRFMCLKVYRTPKLCTMVFRQDSLLRIMTELTLSFIVMSFVRGLSIVSAHWLHSTKWRQTMHFFIFFYFFYRTNSHRPEGTFPKSVGFHSHIRLGKSPLETFGEGEALLKRNIGVDWKNLTSRKICYFTACRACW